MWSIFNQTAAPFSRSKTYWWGLFKYWKDPIPIKYPKLKWLIPYPAKPNCNFKCQIWNRLSAFRKSLAQNRWKWKVWNFVIFAYNIPWPSLFWDFDLSFLKIILKNYFLQTFTGQGILVIFCIFLKNWVPIPHF